MKQLTKVELAILQRAATIVSVSMKTFGFVGGAGKSYLDGLEMEGYLSRLGNQYMLTEKGAEAVRAHKNDNPAAG